MTGYPVQTDAMIDRMYEDAVAMEWEMLNAEPEDSFRSIDQIDKSTRIAAFAPLENVCWMMGLDLDSISEAMEMIRGTAQYDKLASIHDQLTNLRYELRQTTDEVWRSRMHE